MRLWLLRNRARALFGLAPLPPRDGVAVPPVPRVVVRMGRTLPGVLVRLTPGVLALVVAALAGCREAWWVLAAVGAVWLVARPRPQVAAGYVGLAALWLVADGNRLAADPVTGAVPGVGRLAALVLAVHLLLVASALASHVGWTTLVEAAVLGRAARSVGAAQAVAQSALLLVAWVRTGVLGNLELLRGVAVLAVVVAALLLVPREWVSRRRTPPPED
ncbi:hypothetical protein [Actinotalea fermentans]|nr:hypothetical protein [Actinotalea fermentans]